jgi:CRP/FNR family cyclic AMP-dependent transcriptional regulator
VLAGPAKVNVFDRDPDLLEGVEGNDRMALRSRGDVAVHAYAPAPSLFEPPARAGGFGLLVVRGLVAHVNELGGRTTIELLGRGDVLRPRDDVLAGAPVAVTTGLRALEQSELAVLDGAFSRRVAPWPTVAEALCARAVDRTRWLSLLLLVGRLPHVEARLVILFWHLADRWGRVTAQGEVKIPFLLTHELLAALVSAERPTVTTALKRLGERGTLVRESDGWLLRGAPPSQAELSRQALAEAFRFRKAR